VSNEGSDLGLPISATVNSIDFTATGNVVVGGYFKSVFNRHHSTVPTKLIANNIALYNGTDWELLDTGTENKVLISLFSAHNYWCGI
jgi:hypothetical protein